MRRPALRFLLGALPALVVAPGATRAQAAPEPPCPEKLFGIWSTDLPTAELFGFQVSLEERAPDDWQARVRTGAGSEEVVPVRLHGGRLRFQPTIASFAFEGSLAADGSVAGFVVHGSNLVHVRLSRAGADNDPPWFGSASFLGLAGDRYPFDLYIGTEDGAVGGWFFFRDPRLPSLFGHGMRCEGERVQVGEKNLGLEFEGRFRSAEDLLELTVSGPGGSFPLLFRRLVEDPMDRITARDQSRPGYTERTPERAEDGWTTATPSSVGLDPARIGALVEEIRQGELPFTHAVLVARGGRLAVEEYFYGFERATWHDMRSASKTVASVLVGLAIDRGLLAGEGSRVLDYFPQYRQLAHWDPRKARISVGNLLTMSSGLDADDAAPGSAAAERNYQSQDAQRDWMRLALDAPMIADPGAEPRYGSANPMLLGGVLARATGEPVETFAHRTLFEPLGISDYRWFLDPLGQVYLGGGLYLRPRDMAKLGQLYLDRGFWNGARVLSKEWVRRSTAKHGRLANVRDRNEYGYLWWHRTYRVGDREIASIEARGNGGQYIFVVPELDLVAVITSGNYRNRDLLRQPEEILERFILPAAVN